MSSMALNTSNLQIPFGVFVYDPSQFRDLPIETLMRVAMNAQMLGM